MERRCHLSVIAGRHAHAQQARRVAGPVAHGRRDESAVEQRTQSLRDWLVENVIVEGVEDVFPIGPAGNEVADLAIDRGSCDLGCNRKGILDEEHGVVFLPQPKSCFCPQPESCFCHILP